MVAPLSANTLAKVAQGLSDNLLVRNSFLLFIESACVVITCRVKKKPFSRCGVETEGPFLAAVPQLRSKTGEWYQKKKTSKIRWHFEASDAIAFSARWIRKRRVYRFLLIDLKLFLQDPASAWRLKVCILQPRGGVYHVYSEYRFYKRFRRKLIYHTWQVKKKNFNFATSKIKKKNLI